MSTIFWILTVILYIVAFMDLFKSDKQGNQKVIWTLVILLIPTFGAIAYLLIGKKK